MWERPILASNLIDQLLAAAGDQRPRGALQSCQRGCQLTKLLRVQPANCVDDRLHLL